MAGRETLTDRLGIYNNLNDPVPAWNRSEVISSVAATMLCISTFCVTYRLYVRIWVIHAGGWDDVFVLLYLLSGLVGGIALCFAPQFGLGQHFLSLEPEGMAAYLRIFYVINASYNLSTALIKISLLFQYLRVYRSGKLRTTCIVMLVIIGLWGFAYSFMGWVPCFPISGYWGLGGGGARCYAFGSMHVEEFFNTYVSHTVVNAALDMIVFSLPIPLYFQRGTVRRTRLGLVGLVIMGIIVNALSMWRLTTLIQHRATTSPTFDPTWYSPVSVVLGALEVNISSICASVPIFWPRLKAHIGDIFVTREVIITLNRRSHRASAEEDTIELQSTASEHHDNSWKRCPSRASESSVTRLAEPGPVEKRDHHYRDDFILGQVDPLRDRPAFSVESEISSNTLSRQKSKKSLRKKISAPS